MPSDSCSWPANRASWPPPSSADDWYAGPGGGRGGGSRERALDSAVASERLADRITAWWLRGARRYKPTHPAVSRLISMASDRLVAASSNDTVAGLSPGSPVAFRLSSSAARGATHSSLAVCAASQITAIECDWQRLSAQSKRAIKVTAAAIAMGGSTLGASAMPGVAARGMVGGLGRTAVTLSSLCLPSTLPSLYLRPPSLASLPRLTLRRRDPVLAVWPNRLGTASCPWTEALYQPNSRLPSTGAGHPAAVATHSARSSAAASRTARMTLS
jgi:hypothetical protein